MLTRILRLGSMLFDHLCMTLLMFPFAFISLLFLMGTQEFLVGEQAFYVSFVVFLPLGIYLNKDFYEGKSIAKRVMGFQVIAMKTGKPASELQCFLRNLLLLIWPLEVLISIISPHRRMGDLLAHTKVIRVPSEPLQHLLQEIKVTRWKNQYLIIIVMGLVYCYALFKLMSFLS